MCQVRNMHNHIKTRKHKITESIYLKFRNIILKRREKGFDEYVVVKRIRVTKYFVMTQKNGCCVFINFNSK